MKFSAALLAGGKSTRMGRDKAGLQMPDGKLLWQHQVDTLIASGASEIVISGPLDGIYAHSGYRIIPDESTSCGPIGGLRSCLRKIESSHLLLLAVDLPQMTPAYLRQLWEKCSTGKGVVAQGKVFEPMAAFYPYESLSLLEMRVARGNYGFQEMLSEMVLKQRMLTVAIDRESLRFFRNVNYPDS